MVSTSGSKKERQTWRAWYDALSLKAKQLPNWASDYALPTGIALLFLLFWVKSHNINVAQHNQYVATLREIQELDARINQNALQVRLGLLNNYDPLVTEQLRLAHLIATLQAPPALVGRSSRALQTQVQHYHQLWEEKNSLIRQFKSSHAILRNSLAYFPLGVSALLDDDRLSPTQTDALNQLLREILLFNASVLEDDANGRSQQIQQIAQRLEGANADIDSLLIHTDLIVEKRLLTDALIEETLSISTRQQGNSLAEIYDIAYKRAERSANLYRFGLYLLLTGLALSVTADVLLKLRRATLAQQQSENTQQALFQAIPDFMLRMYRGQSVYDVVSVGDGQLLPNPEKQRADLYDVLPAHIAQQRQEAVARALALRETQVYEQQLERSGQSAWEEVRVAPCGKDDVLVMVRDIGDRKQAEAALQRATKEAQVANKAKSQFLSNMSHELRTPLNVILGFTQLLTRNSTLDRQQQQYLTTINQSGEHLLSLINDVLEMSKIEAGKVSLQLSDFDLHGLLEGIYTMFQFKANAKGIALHLEIDNDLPRYIRADESKLRQIFVNLVGNAVKFTRSGGIWLRAGVLPIPETDSADENDGLDTRNNVDDNSIDEKADETGQAIALQFEVQDTGRGIAADEIDDLFDPFVQAKRNAAQADEAQPVGTGLGLPISRRFAELMNGHMSAQSQLGEGSRFYFSMRAQTAARAERLDEARTVIGLAPGQPTYRILVVEDVLPSRQILIDLLAPVGFEVRAAENGLEAVNICKRWQPNLIWMDLRMPVMDGYESARRIRQQASLEKSAQKLVIIALTGSAFKEERAVAIAAGCNDFVTKPFRTKTIFDKIASFLDVTYVYSEADTSRVNINEPDINEPDTSESNAARTKTHRASSKHERHRIGENKIHQITADDLQTMPDDWRGRLRSAATKVNGREVLLLLEEVPAEHQEIAFHIQQLVENFSFEAIVRLASA